MDKSYSSQLPFQVALEYNIMTVNGQKKALELNGIQGATQKF